MTSSFRKIRGFTLIELLVVISIIGLLSSVVLASLSGARESARDARRQQDVRQIQTAIELYMNDHNGNPPTAATSGRWWYVSHYDTSTNTEHLDWDVLENELSPYIDSLPEDPVNEWPLTYYYSTQAYYLCPEYDGDSYVLLVATEQSSSQWAEYGIQGENNSAHRYCVYP